MLFVQETAPVGYPVLTVSAVDPDNEAEDNVLAYSLVNDGSLASKLFYIETAPDSSRSRVGVLKVSQVSANFIFHL